MRLLLLGCSGFIGRELIPYLLKSGHQLIIVTRQKKFFTSNYSGDKAINLQILNIDPSLSNAWKDESLLNAINQVEGVINLAGEPIADKRWSASHCKKIEDSRWNTTRFLVSAMAKLKNPPRVLVNGSAIGYYGTSEEDCFTEKRQSGDDFLASICSKWEDFANKKPRQTRLVILRIGIVLGRDGGALGKMLPIFRAGLGGPIGNGKQWMSWIHRSDLCGLIGNALENKAWSGPLNAVSPNPVLMNEFASALAKTLGRPNFFPVPAPILKILLGDGARVVLEGQNVKSEKLKSFGFKFHYPDLNEALFVETSRKPN